MCGILALISITNNIKSHRFRTALKSLQHRGYDSYGIATTHNNIEKHKGIIIENNNDNNQIIGHVALGHVRYRTGGSITIAENIQPLAFDNLYFVHNGHVTTNTSTSTTTSDSWLIIEAIKKYGFEKFYEYIQGSYSCIIMSDTELIAFRDPKGIRPLVIGTNDNNQEFSFASETVALDRLGHNNHLGDVPPGYMVRIRYSDLSIDYQPFVINEKVSLEPCLFEYIYLAHKHSILNGISVSEARHAFGESLAKNHPYFKTIPQHCVIVPLPKTSCTAAKALAHASGIPYLPIIQRKKNKGRSFILSSHQERYKALCDKFEFSKDTTQLSNKTVLLVDDSIVRGTTMKYMIRVIRERYAPLGIIAVSVAPPVRHSNRYGIDINQTDLISQGYNKSEKEIADELECDRVIYSTLDDVTKCLTNLNPKIIKFETSVFIKST